MSRNTKPASRLSHAGRDSELSQRAPVSLRNLKPANLNFNDSADPLRKKERDALKQSETQRREAMDQGSLMVKLQKPFPDLKPRNADKILRQSFNQDWIKEHQRAALAYLEAQESHRQQADDKPSPRPCKILGIEP